MTSIGQKDPEPAETHAVLKVRPVKNPQVPSLSLPLRPVSACSGPQSYHSLGPSPTWRSLTKDSYISHPLTAWPPDPDLWYGHKTDETAQWAEKNFMNQKLYKTLTEMEKKGTTK